MTQNHDHSPSCPQFDDPAAPDCTCELTDAMIQQASRPSPADLIRLGRQKGLIRTTGYAYDPRFQGPTGS